MTIGWGIIGCGDVTEVKSGPAFQHAKGSRLVAVMRRDATKAEDYARRHGVPYWFDQAEAVIAHPEVDAVYIATPPGSHLKYALLVAGAGKPCYVEKPMARSATECRQMNEAFRKAGAPLFVAYYRRGLARFVKAKERIESGSLGIVTGIHYRLSQPAHRKLDRAHLPWRVLADEAGGGLFMDLGCHTLDILDFMVGPLEHVSGHAACLASPIDVEDRVVMQFQTVSGASGTASWNFASDAGEDRIEVEGTEGRIFLSTFGNEPLQWQYGEKGETFDLPNPRHIQQPLIESILAQLEGQGVCPSTGETAQRTSEVMDTVLESYYGTREHAFWMQPETWPGRREK